MGIVRGSREAKAVLRAPRIHLHSHLRSLRLRREHSNVQRHVAGVRVNDFMPRPMRTGGGDAPADEALTPIAGVSIERYAAVVRGIASYNYDQSMLPGIAADHGIPIDSWSQVQQGWNDRITRDAAVARHFSDIYHGTS